MDYRTAAQIITSDHGQLDAIERQATRPQTGIYERLSMLADDIRAGNDYEYAWQLFRFGHFRRMDDAQAATVLARWGRDHRIIVAFTTRKVRNLEVVYVRFSSVDRGARITGHPPIIRDHRLRSESPDQRLQRAANA